MLNVVIASVDKTHFEGQVESMTCPGTEGELTLLAHHQSMITTLKRGVITVRESKESEQTFSIQKGLLEVAHNKATVLL